MDDDIPYLLLTPGPLTTSRTVRQAMMRDYCTWDDDYNTIVRDIRARLVALADGDEYHTSVLMQGSGTFVVEATLGSVIPPGGALAVVNNGAYGARIAKIAARLGIPCTEIVEDERSPAVVDRIEEQLRAQPQITHIALVHCETTTGMVNPVQEVGLLAAQYGKTYIVDAMSSLGGMPLSIRDLHAQYVISSANKCIQGVPGFGFVVADEKDLAATEGWARSLSLDLFDQWRQMEQGGGKWRFTSPTHTVRAFAQALDEFDAEGGVSARHARYCENHRVLVEGMQAHGFQPLLAAEHRSPIIASFLHRADPRFTFDAFYEALKRRRFVIYPGKVSRAETFRIGTIGHVFPDDIRQLIAAVGEAVAELGLPEKV